MKKQKETKKGGFLIEENGTYKTDIGKLITIKKLDKNNNRIHYYDISDACNVVIPLRSEQLVERIR
jgi:hypothetical protein